VLLSLRRCGNDLSGEYVDNIVDGGFVHLSELVAKKTRWSPAPISPHYRRRLQRL
jgi:hypothetical protein